MWQNALRRQWMSSFMNRSAGAWGGVAILLVVSGCSSFQSLLDASKQPSLNADDVALSAGAPDVALRGADLVAAKQQNDARALTAKGDALYAMGQRELAQTAYRAAVAVDPSSVAAQVGLGRTLAQSDPQAAKTAFLAALKHDPDNIAALNDLGVIYDVRGRHEEAQKAYRHALTVSPEATDVEVNLGRSLALSGHADDARELLHALAGDAGASQQWRAEIAAALNAAGDTRSAQRLLLADNVAPGSTEMSAARTWSSGAPVPSRPDKVGNTLGERSANVALAEGDLPRTAATDARPVPVRVPRIAVAQAELPPILAAPTVGGAAPRMANAGEAPAVSKARIDAVAKAPGVTAAITMLSGAEAGWPPGRREAPQEPARPSEPSALAHAPYVQLASLLSEGDAMSEWRRVDSRFSGLLAARQPMITTAAANGRTYWRLRTFGFADMAEARDLCDLLIEAGLHCFSGRGL
jgi:Flp pilus assembly protein TadD